MVALKTAPVLAAIEQHGMHTATASDIAAVAEHFALAIPRATITDKHITGAMLLQCTLVSTLLDELDVEVEGWYFAVAALVGVAKHVGARRTFPAAPLAAVAGWMQGHSKHADMADTFHKHNVLSIAVPLLEPLAVSLALEIPSKRAKELIADLKKAHPAPGWIMRVDVM